MQTSTLISPDRLAVIRHLCGLVGNVPGNAIEVGVYKGGSLAVIAKAMPHKTVYGFDTFEGLPASKHSTSEHHQPGEFNSGSMEEIEKALQSDCIDVQNFKLVKGIFPECMGDAGDTSFGHVCFAHLDVDFEQSMRDCLEWVAFRMRPGGIIVCDDYGWKHCLGVKTAVDEFLLPENRGNQFKIYTPVKSQCWLQKTWDDPKF